MSDAELPTENLDARLRLLEDRCRGLELELAEAKATSRAASKWLGVVGLIVAGLWGYNTFVQIPQAVKKTNVSLVRGEINELRDEAKNVLLPEIRDAAREATKSTQRLRGDESEGLNTIAEFRRIVRAEHSFTYSGRVADGKTIHAPWGTVDDWNVIVFPTHFGVWESIKGHNLDNALLEVKVSATPESRTQWIVNAEESYYLANDTSKIVQDRPLEVNYVLVPSGSRREGA